MPVVKRTQRPRLSKPAGIKADVKTSVKVEDQANDQIEAKDKVKIEVKAEDEEPLEGPPKEQKAKKGKPKNAPILTDLKVSSIDLKKSKSPHFNKVLSYIKELYADPLGLFPPVKHRVSCTLNASSSLANAIRRTLMEEIPVQALSVDDIQTNDKFILVDTVIKAVQTIPIVQNHFTQDQVKKMSLQVINRSPNIITVYSGDIKGLFESSDRSSKHIFITKLHPGKSLSLSGFKLISGYGYEDASCFSLLSNLTYSALDENRSSTVTNFDCFHLGYTTRGTVEPLYPLELCTRELIKRLHQVILHLEDPVNTPPLGDEIHVLMPTEHRTLSALVSYYCYLEDPDIPFVTYKVDHPSTIGARLRIRHPEWKRVVKNAVTKAIGDLEAIAQLLLL